MEVITLYITGGNGEPDYSVWDSEKSAAKFACSMIAEVINDEWDLGDCEMLEEAEAINDLIIAGSYMEAVNYWNNSDVVIDLLWSNFYTIESNRIRSLSDSGDPIITKLIYPKNLAMTTMANDDLLGLPTLMQSGATCRSCNDHNEYAAADRADGTYMCRGCKGMSEIFKG